MSDALRDAKDWWERLNSLPEVEMVERSHATEWMLAAILSHLEAQQETPASETHSLAATSTQEAIQGSLAISTALSEGISVALTESQAGNLWRYLAEGTPVSCSLVLRRGEQQAAAIFTTRTHKGATPPTSFESLTLAANGAAGNAS